MGLTTTGFHCLTTSIFKNFGTTEKLDLVELGIQQAAHNLGFNYLRDRLKDNFKSYVSLDLHNDPGVTILDLSVYHHDLYKVDIITNFGTTEHVEYEDGQYNCWKNIHNWLKVGGIAIHEIPEHGSWKNHCRFFTTRAFFENLRNYGYEILELDDHRDENGVLNWCVLKKIEDKEFMDQETFYKFMVVDRQINMSTIHPINNPKHLQ